MTPYIPLSFEKWWQGLIAEGGSFLNARKWSFYNQEFKSCFNAPGVISHRAQLLYHWIFRNSSNNRWVLIDGHNLNNQAFKTMVSAPAPGSWKGHECWFTMRDPWGAMSQACFVDFLAYDKTQISWTVRRTCTMTSHSNSVWTHLRLLQVSAAFWATERVGKLWVEKVKSVASRACWKVMSWESSERGIKSVLESYELRM
jgi:hypothetical protein